MILQLNVKNLVTSLFEFFLAPLKNMIASEKQSFISDIKDLRSSLDKLTNKINRLMENEKDEEWNFYEDTYISVSFFLKICDNS